MRSPPRAAPPPRQTMPAHPPPASPAPMGAQPRQPGMFAQMATTAAGVAVGSAVGHTIGHAMTGGGGGGGGEVAAAPPQQQQPAYQDQYQTPPCQFELRQFLECTQNQSDISYCSGFNEALKECKIRYGMQ